MKNSKNIVIGLLCAVVCIMAVAYAAFSTTLKINGTASIDSNWEVKITGIECTPKVTEEAGTQDQQPTIGVHTYSDTTAQFSATLYQPGDEVSCKVTITNSGTIPAMVGAEISPNTDTNNKDTSNAIQYTFEGLTNGTKLAAQGGTNEYTITAKFNPEITTDQNKVSRDVTVSINYVQDPSPAA